MTSQINLFRFILFSALIVWFFATCKENATYKIPGAFKALDMMNQARAYPFDDIPAASYQEGFEFHNKHFLPASKTPVEPWSPMGPLNTAGRCLALAVNPQTDSTLFLGSASGGLWRSRKLGLGVSWEYIPTGFNVLGVSSIAFADQDSSQMYIGTGEVYNYQITGNDGAYRSTRGSYGVGILKSTDGGNTWTKSLDWNYQNQKGVQAVRVDPYDSNNVFAATTDGVYKSSDAGLSWDLVLPIIMATDIEVEGQEIVAACGNFGTTGKGIYRSTDGGASWDLINDPDIPNNFQGKILLARAPSNPSILYASIGNGFTGAEGASWLLRSSDGGITWTLKNTLDYSRWQGWFSHDVSVSPDNPDILTVVGIEIWNSYDGGETLTLTAGGGNLTFGTPPIDGPDGDPLYSHADHHVVTHHPSLPDNVLIGNDGGFFLSRDGAETVRSANGGLQTTQFYNGFSVSQQDSLFAMGGLQDNSTSIFRGDGAWQRAVGGDGSWTGINQENDNIVYGSWQYLNMTKSTDRGESFDYLGQLPIAGQGIFIAPFGIAASNPSRMYAAGRRVYTSPDEGETWVPTNNDLPLNGDLIYTMAIADQNEDMVYVGTAPSNIKSSLFLTEDGGNNWTDVTSNLPDRYINDIAIDPQNADNAYVALNGFGSGHLFKTEDRGATWTDLSTDLPDVPGNAIIMNPAYPNNLYYGNDLGVYFSQDGGMTWEDFGVGLYTPVIAMDLKISPSDQKLWVATHGNGTFRRPLVQPISNVKDVVNQSRYTLYPNPANTSFAILTDEELNPKLIVSILDQKGSIIRQWFYRINDLDISDLPQGSYLVQIQNSDSDYIQTKKLIKQ